MSLDLHTVKTATFIISISPAKTLAYRPPGVTTNFGSDHRHQKFIPSTCGLNQADNSHLDNMTKHSPGNPPKNIP